VPQSMPIASPTSRACSALKCRAESMTPSSRLAGNGAYALVQVLPDGDMLFNSIAGPVRVPPAKIAATACERVRVARSEP
jgi:hypothetical protein